MFSAAGSRLCRGTRSRRHILPLVIRMPIKWKSSGKFKPALVLARIAAVRTVNPTGGASYAGFELEECLPTLHSMLDFPQAAAEVDVQSLAWRALSHIGHDLTPDTFLDAINRTLSEQLAVRESKYTLLTSLSLDPNGLPKTQTILDCRIQFHATGYPHRFSSRAALLRQHPADVAETPRSYACVTAEVQAKSDGAAFGKAMRAVDVFRALLCLMGNPRMQFSFGSSSLEPVNVIRLGGKHTVHTADGAGARDGIWYEPGFAPTKPYQFSKPDIVTKNYRWALRRIGRSRYRESLISSLLRFVRALDQSDPNLAFLRLWSALETLTTPGAADYDKLIHRSAFLFKENDYHRQVLEHLRVYRNANVHAGEESDNARTYCYQLQMYYVNAAWFYIRNALRFSSLEAANEFLDLPPDLAELKRRAAIVRTAIRFASPIAA